MPPGPVSVSSRTSGSRSSGARSRRSSSRPSRGGGGDRQGGAARRPGRRRGAAQRVGAASSAGSWARIAALEALQLAARLEAELLDQRVAGAAVGVERVGLAAGAIEREHQLRVEALAVAVLGGQRLELGDELAVCAAELEVEVDSLLERRQAQLGEPRGLAAGRAVERRVGQRRAAEQRERLAQQLRRLGGRRVGAPARRAPRSARGRAPPAPAAPRSPTAG